MHRTSWIKTWTHLLKEPELFHFHTSYCISHFTVTPFAASLTLLDRFSRYGAHTPPHSVGSHSWKRVWCHEHLARRPGQLQPECTRDLWQQPQTGRQKSHRSILVKLFKGSIQSRTTPKVVNSCKACIYCATSQTVLVWVAGQQQQHWLNQRTEFETTCLSKGKWDRFYNSGVVGDSEITHFTLLFTAY